MSRTFIGSYWGLTFYEGKEYCVGTGCLEITDPSNPQIHNGSNLLKDAIIIDTVVPDRRRLPELTI